jgi:hypothetical protein
MEMAHKLCHNIHGSGLDGEPYIRQSRRNVVIYWDFHMMDNQGFYCGYWKFTVWIPKDNPISFRFTGTRGNSRCITALGLQDYLECIFAEAVRETLGTAGIEYEWDGKTYRYHRSTGEDV